MKKIILTLLILINTLFLFSKENFTVVDSFYIYEIDETTPEFTLEHYDEISNLNWKIPERKRRKSREFYYKIEFNKYDYKDPYILISSELVGSEIMFNKKNLFDSKDQSLKVLDSKTFSTSPIIKEIDNNINEMFINITFLDIDARYEVSGIKIGEKEDIIDLAFSENKTNSIINSVLFLQLTVSFLCGILSLLIFLTISKPKDISILFFSLLCFIASSVQYFISPFASYLRPFEHIHFKVLFSSFILIMILMNLFIIYFYRIKSKLILVFYVVMLATAAFFYATPYKISWIRFVYYSINVVLLGMVGMNLRKDQRFSNKTKIVLFSGFGVFIFLSIADFIIPMGKLFMIFNPFATGIFVIILSLSYALFRAYLDQRQEHKENLIRLEKLEKESLKSQFQALKEQIDPHFLFNSLGTLMGLIEIDSKRASKYVEELSNVYRNILDIQKKELITVNEEVHFLSSYIYLLKQRFQNNFEVEIDIDEELYEMNIPPATMQLLLENAIKHNIISMENPLKIEIKSKLDNTIEIANNLQKKQALEASSNIGLTNLKNRFAFFTNRKIVVNETFDRFAVVIPIINDVE